MIDSPFLVVDLKECDLVVFERILPGNKSFDIAFVPSNYEMNATRVESIDIKELDMLRSYVDSQNTPYYDSEYQLQWKNILQTIKCDVATFIQDGGWRHALKKSIDSDSDDQIHQYDHMPRKLRYINSDYDPDTENSEASNILKNGDEYRSSSEEDESDILNCNLYDFE